MSHILELTFFLIILLLCLFALLVWSFEALAILHSQKAQDRFRTDPWFAGFAFLSSPAVILLHMVKHVLRRFLLFLRLILLSLLVLLAVMVSPAFLFAIPLAYLGHKLLQFAAPFGSRLYSLTLEFYDSSR